MMLGLEIPRDQGKIVDVIQAIMMLQILAWSLYEF